jgi:hypothetical protein
MLLIRGNELLGPRVEVEFDRRFEMPDLGSGQPLTVHHCRNCGSLVGDVERHTDWHYGIAAGRPWGAGPPPGFTP